MIPFSKIAALAGATMLGITANANTLTYTTPSGASTSGGPVNASATFVTGNNSLSIALSDLQANPTDVAQLLSGLSFTLSGGQTTGSLLSSSGQKITVNGNGSFSLGATGVTGWGLNQNVSGGLQLNALGFIGPAGLILGPPGVGALYTAANGSIAGNGPHNPFLNQNAVFVLNIPGVTVDSSVTSATFSFGTVPGIDIPFSVPDGGMTIALLGLGLACIGALRRKLT